MVVEYTMKGIAKLNRVNFQHSIDHYRLTYDNLKDLSMVSSSKASVSSLNTFNTGWMSRCLLWTFHAEILLDHL